MQSPAASNVTSARLENIKQTWSRLQVSRKGIYSVEAVRAFQEYCAKSWDNSMALVLVLPLPALLIIIILECIPLASPSAGWKANYMFNLRAFGYQLICTPCGLIQLLEVLPEDPISTRVSACMVCIAIALEAATLVLISSAWTFPCPFGLLVSTVSGVLSFLVALLFFFKQRDSSNLTTHETLTKTMVKLMLTQATLIVVYPAFSAVFVRLQGLEQAAFVLVLPVIKVLMKNLMANLLLSMPEDIIHTTVFSVELFNAFYVSTCMQTAVNSWSTVVLIVYDALNSAWSLYSIQRASQKVCELHNRLKQNHHEDLLSVVVRRVSNQLNSSVLNEKYMSNKTRRSQKNARVTPEYANKKGSSRKHTIFYSPNSKTQTAILPSSPTRDMVANLSVPSAQGDGQRKFATADQVNISNEDKVLLLQQTQSLLFRCEYLALLEYVEFVVPFIYIIYMMVLYNLPNAKYHANFRYLTEETLASSMKSIALYGSLELLSFITFVSYIRWKFGFSPMKLLGFSFQAQSTAIVARTILFLVFVAQIPYPHFGVDPTFQFDYSDYP